MTTSWLGDLEQTTFPWASAHLWKGSDTYISGFVFSEAGEEKVFRQPSPESFCLSPFSFL